MDKIIGILLLCLMNCNPSLSQKENQIDSLVNEICKTINSNQQLNDDEIVAQIYVKHVNPFLSKSLSNNKDSLNLVIELRLERNCIEYSKIAHRNGEKKGNWIQLETKPNIELNDKTCKNFFKNYSYKYLEPNGDIVELEIKDNYWIDHFKDGTYSKLNLIKISSCEFDIEFIESNNELRKNFSKEGDTFRYQILSHGKGFYKLSVQIPGQDLFYTFKLYYE